MAPQELHQLTSAEEPARGHPHLPWGSQSRSNKEQAGNQQQRQGTCKAPAELPKGQEDTGVWAAQQPSGGCRTAHTWLQFTGQQGEKGLEHSPTSSLASPGQLRVSPAGGCQKEPSPLLQLLAEAWSCWLG